MLGLHGVCETLIKGVHTLIKALGLTTISRLRGGQPYKNRAEKDLVRLAATWSTHWYLIPCFSVRARDILRTHTLHERTIGLTSDVGGRVGLVNSGLHM